MNKSENKKWFFIFFFFSILTFIYLQIISPYYFLRNDNLYQFFGSLTMSLETIIQGKIPWINNFQNMGVPLFEMGYFPVLYPLLILSYIFSKILGNMYLIFEVFSLIHIIFSYFITYLLLKKHIKSDFFSALGSFSFIFSGYLMIKLHDWFFLAPPLLFLPLIFLLNKKNKTIFLGIIRGIYFYTGNIQFVIYTLFFELIYVILNYLKSKKKQKLVEYVKSMILTIIIALPFLALTGVMSLNSSRQASLGGYFMSHSTNPVLYLIGNIIPSFLLFGEKTALYYVNIFIFLGFLYFIVKRFFKDKFKIFIKKPYTALAIISIVLSFGIFGIIYGFMVIIPVWNKFIHPQKLLVFANFFMCIEGSYFLSKKIKKNSLKWILVILSILILFLQLPIYSNHTYFPRNDFPLEHNMPFTDEGRIISLSNKENYDINFMSQNYASIFNLYHLSGYEHLMPKINRYVVPINRQGNFLIENAKINKDVLKEYSVKYVVSDYKIFNDSKIINNYFFYEINDMLPLLFYNSSKKGIDFENIDGQIYAKTNSNTNERIVYTNLYLKNYKIYVDNKEVEKNKDNYGRIYFEVIMGEHDLKIEYKRAFFVPLFISCLAFCILIILLWKNLMPLFEPIFSFLISILENIITFTLKYWIILGILFLILYSVFMIKTLDNQGFMQPILKCKTSISCINQEYEKVKLRKMCDYLKENNIDYFIFDEVKDYCLPTN